MSPIYIFKYKNQTPEATSQPFSKLNNSKNMNFQFLNRTLPSSFEDFDRNETINRQIENLYRLSNVYQILTMGQQVPSHTGCYPFIPVSHRESLSPDRNSKSPRSENDSESSK